MVEVPGEDLQVSEQRLHKSGLNPSRMVVVEEEDRLCERGRKFWEGVGWAEAP
jgi:hypothetical protein